MASGAIVTQDSKLEIMSLDSPPAAIQVKEMISFTAFDGQAAEIDTTSLDSTAKEYLMGLQDFGTFQGEFNFLPSDEGQEELRAAKATRDKREFVLTLSDGSTFAFEAYVLAAPVSGGVDAKVDGSFNLRITGPVQFTAATG